MRSKNLEYRPFLTLYSAGICLLLNTPLSLGGEQPEFDAVRLQTAFASATNLKIINTVRDIPADGQQKLTSLRLGGLADFGEEWAHSHVVTRGNPLPGAQHRFSVVSDEFIAVLYVFAGEGDHPEYRLMLAPRNSNRFCLIEIPELHAFNLRFSELQYIVRPDRDQTVMKTPICQVLENKHSKDL